jgi:hypothetical protein
MRPVKFAFWGGFVMLVMGALAFLPAFSLTPVEAGLPPLVVEASYGAFLGNFPMNIFNKLALLLFGLVGIGVSYSPARALPLSIKWSQAVFVVMGIGAILGMIPRTNTFFGYWPLFGGEVLMHGVFAALGAYFGYALPVKAKKAVEQDNIKDIKPGRYAS